jgi:hypothetical protein
MKLPGTAGDGGSLTDQPTIRYTYVVYVRTGWSSPYALS